MTSGHNVHVRVCCQFVHPEKLPLSCSQQQQMDEGGSSGLQVTQQLPVSPSNSHVQVNQTVELLVTQTNLHVRFNGFMCFPSRKLKMETDVKFCTHHPADWCISYQDVGIRMKFNKTVVSTCPGTIYIKGNI